MGCFVYCFTVILFLFISKAFTEEISPQPSISNYRHFAAGHFKDLPTDSCSNKDGEVDEKLNRIAKKRAERKKSHYCLNSFFSSVTPLELNRPRELTSYIC